MISNEPRAGPAIEGATPDDLSRDVYCILGIPVDAIRMPDVLRLIRRAAASAAPFLISTPNLNFLVNSQSDPDFRESLLLSDLCPADGISIIWIARLIGVPIKHRIAGSDVFAALIADHSYAKPLKVFLFGGAPGAVAAASRALNTRPAGVHCVGSLCPGFGSVDEMSQNDMIGSVNSSGGDLLVVSLGAKKGQLWLLRNHKRLLIPVRVHLGAVVNFQAGTVKRAPPFVQKVGLEWLWRIKEEPNLWRRYWNDGSVMLRLLLTRILPLAVWSWWLRQTHERQDLIITQAQNEESVVVSLVGPATARHMQKIILAFRAAIATKKPIVIDFSGTRAIDARFCGLLLMLNKKLKSVGANSTLMGLSPRLERIFRFHGLGFLLSSGRSV
jgi:N-acetylglucosaminyldiphosphoundecaprenol N-acetyl-beta-D-mannosaminyltransferase